MAGHDVFISHANADKPIADAICARLEARGIRCWIAPRDVPPSAEYGSAILAGIEAARILVLVLSEGVLRSAHVMRELERAVHLGRAILPFRVAAFEPSGSIAYFIAGCHWLDAVTPPLDAHIETLGTSVAALLASPSGRPAAQPPGPAQPPPTPENADLAALVETRIGRYRLTRVVGHGNAGAGFAAWDPDRRRTVFVKLFYPLPASFGAEELTRTVFAALSGVEHPGLVRMLDVGLWTWDGHPTHFLATAFVEGEPLDLWLRAERSLADRLKVAAGLLAAVATVHGLPTVGRGGVGSVGLVHGDIKPANILIRADGTPVLLDFLDFRVAGQPLPRGFDRDRFATMAMGTPSFMAPEQEAQGIVTPASDVYALGQVLIRLFGSDPWHLPFEDDGPNAAPDPLRRFRLKHRSLLASLCARDPAKRPTDLRMVGRILEDAPQPVATPRLLERLMRPFRRSAQPSGGR